MNKTVESAPPVAVIILVWNSVGDTLECLKSLSQSTYPNQQIVLVDNGSRDGVVASILRAYPDVRVLELGTNVGFSAGNNAGIQYAMDRGFEYMLLLNQDTLVASDMLGELVTFAEAHPRAGLIGPAVHCTGTGQTLYALGGMIQWSKGLTCNRGMFEHADRFPCPAEPERVDFVPGCGMLVRRRFLEKAGLLDPQYFFNYEEVEWAVRGRRCGSEAWFLPSARMWHKVSASLGVSSPANTYYMTRNALRFFWTNGTGFRRWSATLQILLRTARSVAAWSLRPRYKEEQYRRRTLANLFAMRDFAFGRFGKMGAKVAKACGIVH